MFALAASIVFVSAGCASSGSQPGTVRQSSPDVITSVEINATAATTAYDLVNRLRPAWLRTGGTGSVAGGRISGMQTLVYVDGTKMGALDALRTLNATGIRSMQWISAARAATILRDVPTDSVNGVISISTEK